MAWTTPRTWVAGELVTASVMNTHVRDNMLASVGCIYDSTLGAPGTFDVTPISGSYAHLRLVLYGRGDTALTSTAILMRFNNDSGANYNYELLQGVNTSVTANAGAGTGFVSPGSVPAASAPANVFGQTTIDVAHYAGSNYKTYTSASYFETADTAAGQNINQTGGIWKSTSVITRVALLPAAGSFAAGTRLTIYETGV